MSVLYSGTCGTCTWSIDSNGLLTVRPTSGSSGYLPSKDINMMSYPWCSYPDDITKIVFTGTITISTSESFGYKKCDLMFVSLRKVTEIDISSLNTTGVVDMTALFQHCTALQSIIASSNFNTSSTTQMDAMFYNCSSLTSLNSVIQNMNTSSTTDMSEMFKNCSSLTSLDLSGFNTSKVESMNTMFENCSSLTSLNISSFNTSKVTDMERMFYECSSLTSLDLSSFSASSLILVDYMFYNCSSLSSITFGTGFNTTLVDDFGAMFQKCSSLTSLDLSMFRGDEAVNLIWMFEGCSKIKTINLSGFITAKVSCLEFAFLNCSELTALNLSGISTASNCNTGFMLGGTDKLSSVTFGNSFLFEQKNGDYDVCIVDEGDLDLVTCVNKTNNLVISNNKTFYNLAPSQRAGEWQRYITPAFSVIAYRTSNGASDSDGADATFSISWAATAGTLRNIKIYSKLATDTVYNETEDISKDYATDSGTDSITLYSIGDAARDYKVVFTDGINTWLVYPSIASNIQLIKITDSGDVDILGDLYKNGVKFLDIIYPIGSIYISASSSSPASLFGGTWTELKDYFLVGAGNKYSVGVTGGSADSVVVSHTHSVSVSGTAATNGAHTHQLGRNQSTLPKGSSYDRPNAAGNTSDHGYDTTSAGGHAHSVTASGTAQTPTSNNGSNANLPPYFPVYMWQRTA